MPLCLSGNPEADALLSDDPLALLIGMVLDQQVPLEWAFAAPLELKRRLGGKLKVKAIATMDPEELTRVFCERPALHRYPASMAGRVHESARLIIDRYGGDATKVWTGANDGAELLVRLKQLPGFGEQKARIFLALLGKQLLVQPDGWVEASSPFGEPGSLKSVADIVDASTLERVRAAKAAAKLAAKAQNAAKAGGAPAKAAKKSPARKSPARKSPAKKSAAKKTAATKAVKKSDGIKAAKKTAGATTAKKTVSRAG